MKKKGVLGILLAGLMSVGMLSQLSLPVIADETISEERQAVPVMSRGTSILKTRAGLDDAQNVQFFGKNWNVIAYEGRDGNGNLLRYKNRDGAWENLYSPNAVTLLCNGHQGMQNTYWGDTEKGIKNEYSKSLLLAYINNAFDWLWLDDYLLDEQKAAILPRTLKGGGGLLGTEEFDANRIRGAMVFNALFWPLSEAEARKLPQSLLEADYHWWLRTPGPVEKDDAYDPDGLVAFVMLHRNGNHEIDYGSVDAPKRPGLLRPAFDLNEDAVVFTTDTYRGKSSGPVGPDALKPVETYLYPIWRLTLKDDGSYPGLEGHSAFQVTAQTMTETGVQVEYTGAATGKNEYISAIVEDSSTGEILSYGNLAKAESADGSVTINLPANRPCTERLYVFNELKQTSSYNDYPDLASKLFPIERTDAVHNWDSGKVTKAPTDKAEGVKTYTCQGCGATKTESIPKLVISGTLTAKAKTKGKTSLTFSWSRIKGAEGYDVFFSPCNKNDKKEPYKLAKTIGKNDPLTWTKTGLKKCSSYKFAVKAFITVNGKKKYVRTSPHLHTLTTGYSKEYTNAKSVTVNKKKVTLKKGKTFRIKADVTKVDKKKKLLPKSHTPKLRYLSTNEKVAKVTSSGKIKAKGKGSCKIIVFAHNGVSKTVTVKVK